MHRGLHPNGRRPCPLARGGAARGFLNDEGKDSFAIGGTVHVGGNQPAGVYTGVFPVVVAYL